MVNFFTEDEVYPNRRFIESARSLQSCLRERGDSAEFSLPHRFFDDLRVEKDIPTFFADLNPEFTGCFAQRMEIRLQNRRTESALLDAEKWIALMWKEWPEEMHGAWWDLAFVHFHDVFTGFHPENVYNDVMSRLHRARSLAENALEDMFGPPADTAHAVQVVNSLPFARSEWVSLPCDGDACCTVANTPSYTANGRLYFRASAAPFSSAIYAIERRSGAQNSFTPKHGNAALENEFMRLTVDEDDGVSLVNRETGGTILDRVRDLLVLQGDSGNFQIENIDSPEQYAWADDVEVVQTDAHSIRASGRFCEKERVEARWSLCFSLRPGEKSLGLQIETDWQAVGKRLRLKLNTAMCNAGDAFNEIPFGVVRRRAYTPAFSRKGEWPVQRFAAIEDGKNGVALINDGAPGVEALGGSLYTTLLRAPTQVYAGMVPDDSSQQHGMHTFRFAILPYAGAWQDSGVLTCAQTHNQPLRLFAADAQQHAILSMLSVDNAAIVLSTVKPAEDAGMHDTVIRLYESTGRVQSCRMTFPGMTRAWIANMAEEHQQELAIENGSVLLHFAPWQIITVCAQSSRRNTSSGNPPSILPER